MARTELLNEDGSHIAKFKKVVQLEMEDKMVEWKKRLISKLFLNNDTHSSNLPKFGLIHEPIEDCWIWPIYTQSF